MDKPIQGLSAKVTHALWGCETECLSAENLLRNGGSTCFKLMMGVSECVGDCSWWTIGNHYR